jgi:two-component system nitrogen regulation response regulator GlnG
VSKILVVDDEESICWGIARVGEGLGHDVVTASSAELGLELAEHHRPSLVVLDVRLPGMDGLAAMKLFRQRVDGVPIVVITAFGDLATAVTAVEQGAFEYILKPFDLHEIRAAIERALRSTPATSGLPSSSHVMLGQSPVMQSVYKRIALAAASDVEVLLTGESGVGKELAAAAIHRHSSRHEGPLVAVNIAALNPTLAEAELFGHVEGAFTGAHKSRNGLLVQADGGTLFIDEVADIPLPLQVKLLRALDQGEVLPVGADRPAKTQFRVVAATHQNLRKKVEAGEFRHDLYYRLCTFEIELPALRARPDDIPILARHFAILASQGKAQLADETLAELSRRLWYGNVRELRNAVEHAVVLARQGAVLPSHLPAATPQFGEPTGVAPDMAMAAERLADQLLAEPSLTGGVYDRFLQEVERPLLAAALNRHGQQCAPAARALGLHRTTLKRKLDQYGISVAADGEDN